MRLTAVATYGRRSSSLPMAMMVHHRIGNLAGHLLGSIASGATAAPRPSPPLDSEKKLVADRQLKDFIVVATGGDGCTMSEPQWMQEMLAEEEE